MAPQATDDRGVSSFLIFSGLSSGRYVLAILLLMLLKVLRKLPLWCLPHHLSPAADKGGRFSHHAADAVAGFSFPAAGGLPKLPSEPARSVGGTHRLVRQHMTDRTRAPKGA